MAGGGNLRLYAMALPATSEVVHLLSAIFVGGAFATNAMFIVLGKPCDTLNKDVPNVDCCLFIHDWTIPVVISELSEVRDMAHAVERDIELLEDDRSLCVSRGRPGKAAYLRAPPSQ